MGKALYRKYRSKKLSEIVGQEHITTTLDNALKQGSISHAYLFTGPRGVGKTSIARILAHEVNGLPYDEESTHLDIIEIDAASNRRIDEIRELREKIHSTPTSAKYKVYIIDEVHMLTKEAFNALLKTLEEPPAHAIFILATTEAHKVPETIISRTQRFTFKPIDNQKAIEHLKSIARKEKIDISDDALQLIAEHGGGSFRDSISLLDQVQSTTDNIDLNTVQSVLGVAPDEIINRLADFTSSGDASGLVEQLQSLQKQGYQAAQVAKQLSQKLRSELLSGNVVDRSETTGLLQSLLTIPASHNPGALLELVLLEAAFKSPHASVQPQKATVPAPATKTDISPPPVSEAPRPEPVETAVEIKELKPVTKKLSAIDDAIWQQVLQAIKRKHNTLYGIARMAKPEFKEGELVLSFAFPFHQKRISESKNKQIISDIIHQETNKEIVITCVLDKTAVMADVMPQPVVKIQANDSFDTISNIFGPSEVLES